MVVVYFQITHEDIKTGVQSDAMRKMLVLQAKGRQREVDDINKKSKSSISEHREGAEEPKTLGFSDDEMEANPERHD